MQKLKGLWIPAEILLNKELSDKEKIQKYYFQYKSLDFFNSILNSSICSSV